MTSYHQARKRFGQNFLIDPLIINHIIHTIAPQRSDNLVEIGPGLGALTLPLLELVDTLHAVEIDRDLIPKLKQRCTKHNHLILHNVDALQFDFRQLMTNTQPLRIIGNLPYNISTPLLFHLLNYADIISDMHFMLQKEVALRLAAKPKTSAYGRLSVMMQYHCDVEVMFMVGAEAFSPSPQVESAIVRLIPQANIPMPAQDINILANVVRAAFGQRRKTLRNALKALITPQQLTSLGIAPQARAEELEISDFVQISNFICDEN